MYRPNVPRFAVVIASLGRRDELHATICSIIDQHHPPEIVIVSIPSLEHIHKATSELPSVKSLISPKGSSQQRNTGVAAVDDNIDIISFFDDDVVIARDYLEVVGKVFLENDDVVLVTGEVLADGVKLGGLVRTDSQKLLEDDFVKRGESVNTPALSESTGYGCNMSVRRDTARKVTFDTRLPLYGWLEDLDYSFHCGKFGRTVKCDQARLVHLGVRSGRTSAKRLGYSQIMNSYYLYRKGSLRSLRRLLVKYWFNPFAKNLALSVFSGENSDRRDRALGNLMAFGDICRGFVSPERILEIDDTK